MLVMSSGKDQAWLKPHVGTLEIRGMSDEGDAPYRSVPEFGFHYVHIFDDDVDEENAILDEDFIEDDILDAAIDDVDPET